MRDFRDAKAMARTLRAALAGKGLKITLGESLELIARALGAADWNTLAAAIKATQAAPAQPAPAARPAAERPPRVEPSGHVGFSPDLDVTLHRAVELAEARKHGYATLEHLLLALTDDAGAAAVLEACKVDVDRLRRGLTGYVDGELQQLTTLGDPAHVAPTAGFQRAIQRAVVHVRTSGRDTVTGANLLVAIFPEPESRAAGFLSEQEMERFDAVNFIAHGIRKNGKAA